MITTTIITSMSVNPRVLLRMRLPFLWRGCYELAAGAAKSGDRRRVSPPERCGGLQYSVRKITGLAGLCVLAAALLVPIGDIGILAGLSSFSALLAFLAVNLALVVLRFVEPIPGQFLGEEARDACQPHDLR